MRNDGSEAEEAFINRKMNRPGVVIERIRDAKDLRGINNGRAVGDFAKPSDFLVTEDGLLHYAEVKSCQGSVSFPFSNIKPGQKSAALRQAAVGCPYVFYIWSYGLEQWFLMPAKQFAEVRRAGKSSIKFKDLQEWK